MFPGMPFPKQPEGPQLIPEHIFHADTTGHLLHALYALKAAEGKILLLSIPSLLSIQSVGHQIFGAIYDHKEAYDPRRIEVTEKNGKEGALFYFVNAWERFMILKQWDAAGLVREVAEKLCGKEEMEGAVTMKLEMMGDENVKALRNVLQAERDAKIEYGAWHKEVQLGIDWGHLEKVEAEREERVMKAEEKRAEEKEEGEEKDGGE